MTSIDKQEAFYFFCRDEDRNTEWISADAESLQAATEKASKTCNDARYGWHLVAWTTEKPRARHSYDAEISDAIAAGRAIEFREGKYLPLGLNEAKQETPFRIGGIYRQQDGLIVRLSRDYSPHVGLYPAHSGEAYAHVIQSDGEFLYTDGTRRLSDGVYEPNAEDRNYGSHLVHGEVESSGNPIATFYAAIEPAQSRTPTLDKLEQQKAMEAVMDKMAGQVVHRQDASLPDGWSHTVYEPNNQQFVVYTSMPVVGRERVEEKRPRLTWADSKPFDAFPGYQSRTINSSWAAPDSGKFADRRRDSPQVNPGHALAAVRQLVR